jgi:hypothetical protein
VTTSATPSTPGLNTHNTHDTDSTDNTVSTVKLTEPSQLIAAVPHLLGFRPDDSVVLIGHHAGGGRVGVSLRADLPPPGREREAAGYLVGTLCTAANDCVAATIVVVGGTSRERAGPAKPPRAALVRAITDELTEAGLRCPHAVWAREIIEGARWACYPDGSCAGTVPDPAGTVLAAAMVRAGAVTYGSREAMERRLDPADPAILGRRSALLASARADHEPGTAEAIGRAAGAVRAALIRVHRGDTEFTDDEIVRLALALEEPRVRDASLALALSPDDDAAEVSARLWSELVRGIPAPESAHPAALLGFCAYARGEGALAGMAFEHALTADPAHALAGLLQQALRHALHPKRLRGLATAAEEVTLWPEPTSPSR